MSNLRKITFTLVATLIAGLSFLQAQSNVSFAIGQDTTKRPITTAVPFLTIAPDARAAAMGDLGAATSPDVNSIYWNAAKLAFIEGKAGASLSYSPWLRNLVDDMYLAFLSGYYKLDDRQAFGFALRYFNLGEIEFIDANRVPIRDFRPNEVAVAATYALKLSDNFSAGITGRFIHSNLSADLELPNAQESRPGITGSADLSFYYNNKTLNIGGREAELSVGASISNIGAKISYASSNDRDFIPTNLRIGTALTMNLDQTALNKVTLGLDFNKLMTPTPPRRDSQNQIVEGTDPRDRNLISGIFGSFADAPDGFGEEIQEIMISIGAEYSYDDVFFARAGYFSEHENKGNRKYFTVGAGFKYQIYGLDVAYLIPRQQQNPLAETLRFTFSVTFDKKEERVYDGS